VGKILTRVGKGVQDAAVKLAETLHAPTALPHNKAEAWEFLKWYTTSPYLWAAFIGKVAVWKGGRYAYNMYRDAQLRAFVDEGINDIAEMGEPEVYTSIFENAEVVAGVDEAFALGGTAIADAISIAPAALLL